MQCRLPIDTAREKNNGNLAFLSLFLKLHPRKPQFVSYCITQLGGFETLAVAKLYD